VPSDKDRLTAKRAKKFHTEITKLGFGIAGRKFELAIYFLFCFSLARLAALAVNMLFIA
jgi:hypothetical protein